MEHRQWLGILSTINADNDLNGSNVIEKIREKLKAINQDTWQGNHFDINYTFDGDTLLHITAINHSKEVVEALINAGADVNRADQCGRTPLHLAAYMGYIGIARALIQETLIQDFSTQKPDYLTGAFSTYWDGCKNEIEGEKIGSSNILYLDLLKADEDKVASYMINHEVKSALRNLDYEKEFPIFGSQIKNKFCEGVKRRDLIDDGIRIIQCFDFGGGRKLISEISEKIAFYLPNPDLKKLKDIEDNNKNAHVKPSTKIDETKEEQGITGDGRKV